MTKQRLFATGSVVLVTMVWAATPLARQQRPAPPAPAVPSAERAQDQPFPPGSPFALLPGFKIERVTPLDKTESYIVVTFDAIGRPVVSQSSSSAGVSPRLLLDNDGDGIFESEKIVSDKINTCHGLFYASRTTLYADCKAEMPGDPPADPGRGGGGGAAQGAPAAPGAPPQQGRGGNQPPAPGISGLYKLEDTNGDDVMDTIERIHRYTSGGMGDHGPHAIRRAPDGSINFIIGNNTYVGSAPVNDDNVDTAASANWNDVKERQFLPAFNDPRFGNSTRVGVHATLWRLQPDNKVALLYSGMRNPYDFAFNLAGEAFIFDSDMEWDVNAPWYREVNTIHAIPGGDGGYRNGTGKFQDEYFDVIPPMRHLRRGSPVGVEVYESYAYPASFFDNLFEADWSRGRLLYTALTPSGGTYRGRDDLAEFVHGEPMPITDIEVGPDGNLYLTTGGAAGQGGLYKVSWTGAKPAQPDMTGILAVVRQPQPLSTWGWAAIEKAKASMGASFGAELERIARDPAVASMDRLRAVLELQRHGPAPSVDLLKALVTDRDADVRAAAVFAAGIQTGDGAKAVAAQALKDTSQFVKRRAAEAIVRQGLTPSAPSFAPVADLYALLADPDRFVRYSGRIALEHTPRSEWINLVMSETRVIPLTEGLLALTDTVPAVQTESELRPIFDKLIGLMKRQGLTPEEKIRVLRAFEVAATEVPAGVDPEIKAQVFSALSPQFPAVAPAATYVECSNGTAPTGCGQTMLAHHMAKVLAYTGEPIVIDKVFAIMPRGEADQPGQIDYMYALRVIEKGWTPARSQKAIDWFARASKWRGGSTFSGHVNTIFDATVDAFDAAQKQMAYKAAPLFAPLTADEVATVAANPGRGGGGGRGAAAGANAPPAAAPPAGAPVAAGASVAGAAPATPGRGGGRGAASPALTRGVPLDRQERYENLVFPRGGGPGSLAGRGGAPNATAGAQTFQTLCASCHKFGTQGETYGPDLSTIGTTMARRDILRAIFFPAEKVDPKYEATVVTTRDKKTITGLVVSETAQALVLKTAEDAQPVTVQKAQVLSRAKPPKATIMPQDLIDKAGGDINIANVVAFLMAGK